jgi:hypothetical protein
LAGINKSDSSVPSYTADQIEQLKNKIAYLENQLKEKQNIIENLNSMVKPSEQSSSPRSLGNSKTEGTIKSNLFQSTQKRMSNHFVNSSNSPSSKGKKRIKSYMPYPSFKESFGKKKSSKQGNSSIAHDSNDTNSFYNYSQKVGSISSKAHLVRSGGDPCSKKQSASPATVGLSRNNLNTTKSRNTK